MKFEYYCFYKLNTTCSNIIYITFKLISINVVYKAFFVLCCNLHWQKDINL